MVVLKPADQVGTMEGRNKIVLVAQEITFAKSLASNDLRIRNRAIRKLRKWLQNRAQPNQATPFTRDDMLRIWKGLFYCMWMSDKPLIQEELAENICSLVHCLNQHSVALNFVEAFFLTMREEWFNIDTFRLNKFQMLVRRMLRQALALVARKQWNSASQLANIVWTTVLKDEISRPPPLGLGLHVCEIFIEELAKVSGSTGISQKALTTLFSAFARCLASKAADTRLRTTVCSAVFGQLIKQSDAGLEHQEKVQAWRRLGCPAIPLDQLERMEIDEEEGEAAEVEEESEEEEEEEEKELDPRAGQVDVELPQIPFNPMQIASMIRKFIADPGTNTKAKRRLKILAQKFTDLDHGKYPLAFSVPLIEEDEQVLQWDIDEDVEAAAEDLQRFDQQLEQEEVDLGVATSKTIRRVKAQQQQQEETPKGKKRRKRRKPSWKVTPVTEEESVAKTNGEARSSPGTQGQWQVSPVKDVAKAKTSAWSEPLKEGEYEYFVAPRKNKTPDKKLGKKRRSLRITKTENKEEDAVTTPSSKLAISPKANKYTNVKLSTTANTIINANTVQINTTEIHVPGKQQKTVITVGSPNSPGGKKRTLVDSNMFTPVSAAAKKLKSPSTPMTPGSSKRVDIQLKHNKFQELHEHAEQIRNSPGVPHDPNKRPTKSLLKTPTASPSPLFTKKRGSILFS